MIKFVGMDDQIRFFKNETEYDGFIDFSSPFILLDTYVHEYLKHVFVDNLNCENTTTTNNDFYIQGKYCLSSQIGNSIPGMPTIYTSLPESNTTNHFIISFKPTEYFVYPKIISAYGTQ